MPEIDLSSTATKFLAAESAWRLAQIRLRRGDQSAQKDLGDAANSAARIASSLKPIDLAALNARSVFEKDPLLNDFLLRFYPQAFPTAS